jgi:hypothetical protein
MPDAKNGNSTQQGGLLRRKFSGLWKTAYAPALGDPRKEAAASKLWAVYVSEAERYDKSLIESWKSDMEGMLIFVRNF